MILIGPGTGIAPFRAFCQYRTMSQATGPILVFFGCRNKAKDYYYSYEWDHSGAEVIVAASRDQEEKVYVQHAIQQHGLKVWEIIQAGAWIYISGAADKMPTAVKKSLAEVCQQHGKMDIADADGFIERLSLQNRLQEETWS